MIPAASVKVIRAPAKKITLKIKGDVNEWGLRGGTCVHHNPLPEEKRTRQGQVRGMCFRNCDANDLADAE